MLVSIVVPTLNEASNIGVLLQSLCAEHCELIVADGGSSDDTVAIAETVADRVLQCPAGRAAQMNAGAAHARGERLWFVHADTTLLEPVASYLSNIRQSGGWGFFALRLSGRRRSLRIIEAGINWRSRSSCVATGDQGIFVTRELFERLGGFDRLPLMEDVAISKRLRSVAQADASSVPLQTSSRRWEQNGVLSTMLLMWRLRLLYFFGAKPDWLARQYR